MKSLGYRFLLCCSFISFLVSCSDTDEPAVSPIEGEWVEYGVDESDDVVGHFIFHSDDTYCYWTTQNGSRNGTNNVMIYNAEGYYQERSDLTLTLYNSVDSLAGSVFIRDSYSVSNGELSVGERHFVRPSVSEMPWVPMVEMYMVSSTGIYSPGSKMMIYSRATSPGNHCDILSCTLRNYLETDVDVSNRLDNSGNLSISLNASNDKGVHYLEFVFECQFTNDYYSSNKSEIHSYLIYTVS